jgi:hypothetical protein
MAILFTLAVVGGAVPAASFGHGYLVTAVLGFAAALAALLLACIGSGWLMCERRMSMSVSRPRAATPPSPAVPDPVRARPVIVPIVRQRWAADAGQGSAARSVAAYVKPLEESAAVDAAAPGPRIAFARLALSQPPAETS